MSDSNQPRREPIPRDEKQFSRLSPEPSIAEMGIAPGTEMRLDPRTTLEIINGRDAKRAFAHARQAFVHFARNGRWGFCCHCPRDFDEQIHPEKCVHTERADHQRGLNELVLEYKACLVALPN